jgi:hypothetical protein
MAMKTMGNHAKTYFHIAGSFPQWLSRTVRLNQHMLLAFLQEIKYISTQVVGVVSPIPVDFPMGTVAHWGFYDPHMQDASRWELGARAKTTARTSAPPSWGGDNIKVQNHLILVFNGAEKSTVGFIAEAALQQAE